MTSLHDQQSPDRESLIPTRWSLLSRLKDWDDQESWRDFFDTYWKLIYNVASKAGLNNAEAQEVVQDTVMAVARHINQFRTDPQAGSFKGWLLNTTRWRILDHQRKRQRDLGRMAGPDTMSARTPLLERIPDPHTDALETIWNEEWERNMTETALERVRVQASPRQFQIFDLYVIKQWPAAQVAKTLQVNMAQVYLAKHRIARLLRLELERLQEAG